MTETTVSVRDLGSVNGVYINSRRINESMSVKDGDRIQIGQHEFKLRMMVRESVPVGDRLTAETLHGLSADPSAVSDEQTHAGDVFDLARTRRGQGARARSRRRSGAHPRRRPSDGAA